MSRALVPPAGAGAGAGRSRPARGAILSSVAIGAVVLTALGAFLVAPARARAKQPPALAGLWRLDPTQTVTPGRRNGGPPGGGFGGGGGGGGGMRGGRRGGFGGGGGGFGGGGGGGRRGMGGGGGDGPRGGSEFDELRPTSLPPLLRIDQHPDQVTVDDSTGTALLEIATGVDAPGDTAVRMFATPHFTGLWKGSKLVVEHEVGHGALATETWRLKKRDRELEIETRIQPPGSLPSREFKRVYLRSQG